MFEYLQLCPYPWHRVYLQVVDPLELQGPFKCGVERCGQVIYLSIYLSIYVFIYWSIDLPIHSSICLSFLSNLSPYLSIYLSRSWRTVLLCTATWRSSTLASPFSDERYTLVQLKLFDGWSGVQLTLTLSKNEHGSFLCEKQILIILVNFC